MGLSDRRRALLGRLRRRKSRAREGLVLVEGVRSAEEVLASAASLRWAACAPGLCARERGRQLEGALESAGVEIVRLSDRELAAAAATENPQGVLLVVEEPRVATSPISAGGRYLAADGVQDPGNLGTLIRTGLAFGVDAAVVLGGTVDPWNPKTVRSAAGACFRLPVAQAEWSEVRSWIEGAGVDLLAAATAGEDVASVRPSRGWMLVVGSEGRGVSEAVSGAAQRLISIPMPGGTESLNAGVAGAILLYVLTRNGQNA
jgi:TrmH family RNA methyltransferase